MPDRDITRRGRLISRYTAALRRMRAAAPTWLGRLVQCTVIEVEPEMRPYKRMSRANSNKPNKTTHQVEMSGTT
jgi:hypothetical protein